MALFNMAELLAVLPRHARLLGIDPGAKRIGLALCDVERCIASPYGVITRSKMKVNAAQISAIAERENVGGLVVGLALNDDQEAGPAAQAAQDWAHALSAATGLPVAMHDESLTTFNAHEHLIAAGLSRTRRAALVDQMAAAAILQSALDEATRKKGGVVAPPNPDISRS